jgi:long-chain-fatty-acid--[acyl-carrier-protein] ligase
MIDRLGIDVEGAEFLFLEDLRSQIGKLESLAAVVATYVMPSLFMRSLPRQMPDDPAVYLFTSGSESMPKTVPLSHRNVLTNVCDGLEILDAKNGDSLLGFLPPFHSFGLTGNVVLPHLAGIRSVRYPDPTDARGLVRTIEAYRPTMVFTTPTFLGYLFAVCQGTELTSLKKIITGAEKCPDSIFERCAELAPDAQIMEGYGITECSPVVAANSYGNARYGSVGRPVKSVEVCVVDLETGQRVPPGQSGMLLVAGPSIFSGYHGFEGSSPFVSFEGKSWYKTGDLVSMDQDGYIYFQGRLKRFLKAGGEMISLPALEEPFLKLFPTGEDGPRVAVEGVETPDGRHITLFTTFDYSMREASAVLHESGLRGVMRLDEVRRIETIPVLGTGKTDYKQLRNIVLEDLSAK